MRKNSQQESNAMPPNTIKVNQLSSTVDIEIYFSDFFHLVRFVPQGECIHFFQQSLFPEIVFFLLSRFNRTSRCVVCQQNALFKRHRREITERKFHPSVRMTRTPPSRGRNNSLIVVLISVCADDFV